MAHDHSSIGFRPLYNAILIRPDPPEGETERNGVVILAPSKQGHSHTGTVLACGRGYRVKNGYFRPLEVEPGDRVVYAYYGGEDHEIQGEKLQIVPGAHVYGVIEAEEEPAECLDCGFKTTDANAMFSHCCQ